MKQVFGSLPRCRIAMETGTHSPWVSRLLTTLGHEVIVAHAQKVRLISKSRRKDDRLDARSLARIGPAFSWKDLTLENCVLAEEGSLTHGFR